MTNPESSVTREGMLAAAERMSQTFRAVEAERGQVETAITMLYGSFSGGGAAAYRSAMSGWFANVEEVKKALNDMVVIMETGAQKVGQSDSATTELAQEGARQMVGLRGL